MTDPVIGDRSCSSCLCLTFTAGQGMAPLSFILTLQHWLPHQVETRIAGQLDLSPGAHLHSGGMQVGDRVLQFGAVWVHRYGGVRATVTNEIHSWFHD